MSLGGIQHVTVEIGILELSELQDAAKKYKILKLAAQDILDSDKRNELHRDPLDTDIYFKALKKALK